MKIKSPLVAATSFFVVLGLVLGATHRPWIFERIVTSAEPSERYIIQASSSIEAQQLVLQADASFTHVLPIIDAVAARLTTTQFERLQSDQRVIRLFLDNPIQTASDHSKKSSKERDEQDEQDELARLYRAEAKKEVAALRVFYKENYGSERNQELRSRIRLLRAHWQMKIQRPRRGKNVPQATMVDFVDAELLHQSGVTGYGIGVAILDTGMWIDRAVQRRNGFNDIVAEYNAITDMEEDADDEHGHGTHLASIIASRDFGPLHQANGLAPDAGLIIVKAFDHEGKATYANIIRGINWIVDNQDRYNIRVLNLSFSAPVKSVYWEDPLNLAVMNAWQSGIVVVVSAGNEGPEPMSIGVPGNIPYVITVGAMTDSYTPDDKSDDVIVDFSSRGPTVEGFIKPDLVATGGHLSGIMNRRSTLALKHPDFHDNERYFMMSGTSQAAAVVSGTVALLLQYDTELTPAAVKCRLMSSAQVATDESGEPVYSVFEQGAGNMNALEAFFSDESNCANVGLDVISDITGEKHFLGPARQDIEGTFYLEGYSTESTLFTWDGTPTELSETSTFLWNNSYMWNNGYMPDANDATSQTFTWNNSFFWNNSFTWNNSFFWNNSFTWNNSFMWNNSYMWNNNAAEIANIDIWVDNE